MTYREIRFLSVVGPAALPPDQLDRVSIISLKDIQKKFKNYSMFIL